VPLNWLFGVTVLPVLPLFAIPTPASLIVLPVTIFPEDAVLQYSPIAVALFVIALEGSGCGSSAQRLRSRCC
jgi:hypothetical protein